MSNGERAMRRLDTSVVRLTVSYWRVGEAHLGVGTVCSGDLRERFAVHGGRYGY
jgi:hypothetical protein